MQLTAGELIEELKKVDADSVIRFQWIEDKYIKGKNEHPTFYGERSDYPFNTSQGWTTYDMPCDTGSCAYGDYQEIVNDEDKCKRYCSRCEHRNRYIGASRCFIHDGLLFIDGHY